MNFHQRATEKEILDDFGLGGNELSENLRELEKVNHFLGGHSSVLKGVTEFIKSNSLKKEILLLDAGCGGGDVLRAIFHKGKKENWNLKLEGIDANQKAIQFAKSQTKSDKIRFAQMNIFSPEFRALKPDVFLFNLCLHHFENEEIITTLKRIKDSKKAVIISDLRRSKTAYRLFQIVSRVFGISHVGRHDGLLSIRKGFLQKEWQQLLQKAGFQNFTIQNKWAFRHLIIATK